MRHLKRLIPALLALGFAVLLMYQLMATRATSCRVCVAYKGLRKCATGAAPEKAVAQEEAHRSACSQMTRGVGEAFECPQVEPELVECKAR